MEYYSELARKERKLGDEGSRQKIDEYLRLAQEAAKELGPYRHGRASAGESAGVDSRKNYVVRSPLAGSFDSAEEWQLWAKIVIEKETDERQRSGLDDANERIIARWFTDKKKPPDATIN